MGYDDPALPQHELPGRPLPQNIWRNPALASNHNVRVLPYLSRASPGTGRGALLKRPKVRPPHGRRSAQVLQACQAEA